MMLVVEAELLDEIRRRAEAAYPMECCGVLGGEVGDAKRALRAVATANTYGGSRTSRYRIDPDELRRIDAALASAGLEIVGYYHSHPDAPPHPSELDREQAWPWYSYLIVALTDGSAREATSWVLADDRSRFERERLLISSEV